LQNFTQEVIGGAWKKKDKAETSPTICKIIDWFNRVTSWAQTEIVQQAHLRDRVFVLSRFIQIAEHCLEMHNYVTGMQIVSALQNSSVSRLTRTWRGLSRKELAAWQLMQALFNNENNFRTYRSQLGLSHNEPCLPYMGVLLQDLLMVEELPTFLQNKMVNFRKMRRFAGLLKEEIQDRQTAADRYAFEVSSTIRDYLQRAPTVRDDELYKLSRLCEPATLA